MTHDTGRRPSFSMLLRIRIVLAVFRAAFANPVLRRVGFAYALFVTAEFGIWIALLVFAYRHGGSTAGMVMVLVQLVPCIALGPLFGALADRRRPSRVLLVGYGLQALSMAGVAVAIGAGASTVVVFVLAPLTALSLTVTRPPQAALLPAIVRTPDELTAANVMSGWTDGAAALLGPAITGVLLAWHGLALAIGATAAMSAVAALLAAGVNGPAAAISSDKADEDDTSTALDTRSTLDKAPFTGPVAAAVRALASIGSGARSNLMLALRNPSIRILLVLHAFYFTLIGALDLLCVILALNILHMGPGGPGFLNAALGAGALVAGFVTAFLVGRRHLANTLTIALLVAVTALAIIDAVPTTAAAILLIGTVGLSGAVFDITSRMLLQRSAPADAIAGSFSILEALMDAGLAMGAVLVRVAIAIGGLKAAFVAPAVIALVLVAGMWRQVRRIDAGATVPQVEIQLLPSIPIFAALQAPALEGIARELEPVSASAGSVVIREGDHGDYYYAVADGELIISRGGHFLQTVSRGDGFGEIAPIRDLPRQASVTAVSDVSLYALRADARTTSHFRVASHLGLMV